MYWRQVVLEAENVREAGGEEEGKVKETKKTDPSSQVSNKVGLALLLNYFTYLTLSCLHTLTSLELSLNEIRGITSTQYIAVSLNIPSNQYPLLYNLPFVVNLQD